MADPAHPTSHGEPPSFADWRRLAEKALAGRDFATLRSRTRDGIPIEPLYPPRTDTPACPGRGSRPWAALQIVDDPDAERANRQALEDVAGGATGLALRFADAASAAGFGLPPTEEGLVIALDGVDLAKVQLRIEPHLSAADTARWLHHLIARRGIAPELTAVSWGLDPIVLDPLASGAGGDTSDRLASLVRELGKASFGGPLAEADARIVHEAGGTEAQELAALLAGAVWWLRALERAGVGPEAGLPLVSASLAVDQVQFLSIAKLRAARLSWTRLAELCGAPLTSPRIHAETSRRMMIRADPHSNLLRTTIAAFAAAAGGADSLTILPFDAPLGFAGGGGRALARNLHHLLVEESQVHRVDDPGAGSGLIEALTERLAEAAWAEFQRIETEGGILESLRTGAFQTRVEAARTALQKDIATGTMPLVGATVYREGAAGAAPDQTESAGAVAHGFTPVRLEALAEAAA